MPRLLIISPSAHAHGGVETILNDLCAELPKRGWDVVLGLTASKYFHDVEHYATVNPGLPIHVISAPFATRRSRISALVESVVSTSPDVVLVTRIADAYHAMGILKRSGHAPRLAVAVQGFEAQYIIDVKNFRRYHRRMFHCGRTRT